MLEITPDDGYMATWEAESGSLNSFGGFFGAKVFRDFRTDLELLKAFILDLVPVVQPLYGTMARMDEYWAIPMDLKVRLPNVPWLSIYGEPYVEMFGEDRLFAAPFWKVWKLDTGHVIAQLSEHIDDDYGEAEVLEVSRHTYMSRATPALKYLGDSPLWIEAR